MNQPDEAVAADGNFIFGAMPPSISAALRKSLQDVEPATLGHILDEGFTGPEMKMLSGVPARVIGTAITCKSTGDDSAIVHYAIAQIRPGDFLVIDRGGDARAACFGGGLALAASRAGCAGVLIDGPATDIDEIVGLGLPVWATGLTPLTTRRRYRQGWFCVPVRCGTVTVNAGDIVIADRNGAVFLAPAEAAALGQRALKIQQDQAARYAKVRAGGSLAELNGTVEAFARIRNTPALTRQTDMDRDLRPLPAKGRRT